MRVLTLGVHVLDVLARPVEGIPDGQGSQLLEEIRAAPAGTAGGTAVTLAKLGARVRTAGAIGDDALGALLVDLLERHGVDSSLLVRRAEVQTSASVLPIRPNGDRPALHVIGANGAYGLADAPREAIADATHLHLGGPEFLGGEAAGELLALAHEHGAVTSADVLADGNPGLLDWIAPAFPQLDHLLPNDAQVLGFTGEDDLVAGCRALIARGVTTVAATRGGDGAVVVTADDVIELPAFAIDVVDTSGCGDAFSAGYLRGLSLGRDPRACAVLGSAAAALVAQGLGSDHGAFDLAAADAFAAATPTR
ncbi:carbohydrate kinase family protein [Patulibacter defluvii]|uniref:carbohydrate kinase family protein n=1 Tax=Patulibacter defluvii TaxID=3095358 RepID=UPI002A748A8B|nr:PfkB family carbohydrate kinase [Patulibacter sp. DM4]